MKIPVIKDDARRGFNLREFCEAHGYDVSTGGGAHMWREVWNETVSDIYRDTLSEHHSLILLSIRPKVVFNPSELPEPLFAYPPVQDRYGEVKRLAKYAK